MRRVIGVVVLLLLGLVKAAAPPSWNKSDSKRAEEEWEMISVEEVYVPECLESELKRRCDNLLQKATPDLVLGGFEEIRNSLQSPALVSYLLSKGASPQALSMKLPLHVVQLAAIQGYVHSTALLINAIAREERNRYFNQGIGLAGAPLLHYVAAACVEKGTNEVIEKEYIKIARLLIGAGANIRAEDRQSRTVLDIAKLEPARELFIAFLQKAMHEDDAGD